MAEINEYAHDPRQRLPIKFRFKAQSAPDECENPYIYDTKPEARPAKPALKPPPAASAAATDELMAESVESSKAPPAFVVKEEDRANIHETNDDDKNDDDDDEPEESSMAQSNEPLSEKPHGKTKSRKDENENRWMERYEELKIYKKKHGDCNVPKGYPENPKLGRWVQNQRMYYKRMQDPTSSNDRNKKKASRMTQRHADLLTELGFKFKLRDEWIDRYRELESHFKKHGTCNIPRRFKSNPSLGHFVAKQRFQMKLYREKKPSSMNLQRIRLLEQINFDWNVLEAAWMEHYNELEDYYNEHGNCLVPEKWPSNPSLGLWVGNQRAQYKLYSEKKPTKITKERIRLLERLDFEWSVPDARWMLRYVELGHYVRQHGIGSLPSKEGDHKELRRWTDSQIARYKEMSPRHRDLLELLGITWLVEGNTKDPQEADSE